MTMSADKQRVVGRPFQSGQSGNPKGRPKKEHTLTSCVRQLLDGDAEKIKAQWKATSKMTGAQYAAVAIISKLSKGDAAILREVWQRTEGRVPQPVNIGNQSGEDLIINYHVHNGGMEKLLKRVQDGEGVGGATPE